MKYPRGVSSRTTLSLVGLEATRTPVCILVLMTVTYMLCDNMACALIQDNPIRKLKFIHRPSFFQCSPLQFFCVHGGSYFLALSSSQQDDDGNNSYNKRKAEIINDSKNRKRRSLENDIQRKLSLSKDRAISALSKPSTPIEETMLYGNNTTADPNTQERRVTYRFNENSKRQYSTKVDSQNESFSTNRDVREKIDSNINKDTKNKFQQRVNPLKSTSKSSLSQSMEFTETVNRARNEDRQRPSDMSTKKGNKRFLKNKNNTPSFVSLPPLPPLENIPINSSVSRDTINRQINSGLTSWEEFLGAHRNTRETNKTTKILQQRSTILSPLSSTKSIPLSDPSKVTKNVPSSKSSKNNVVENNFLNSSETNLFFENDVLDNEDIDASRRQPLLPSIQELFPLELSNSKKLAPNPLEISKPADTINDSPRSKGEAGISSVSSSSRFDGRTLDREKELSTTSSRPLAGISPVSDLFYRSSQAQNQQEEFDDDLDHDDEELPFSAEQSDAVSSDQNKIRIRRNMVQEQVEQEIRYENKEPSRERYQDASSKKTSPSLSNVGGRGRKMVRRGMEMLVGGIPINADPPQRSLELYYDAQQNFDDDPAYGDWMSTISLNTRDFGPLLHASSMSKISRFERGLFCEHICNASMKWDICPPDLRAIVKAHKLSEASFPITQLSSSSTRMTMDKVSTVSDKFVEFSKSLRVFDLDGVSNTDSMFRSMGLESRSKSKLTSRSSLSRSETSTSEDSFDEYLKTKGEFNFHIGVSCEELSSGVGGSDGGIVKVVFTRAFIAVLKRAMRVASENETKKFIVEIPNIIMNETDDGYTSITAEFNIRAAFSMNSETPKRAKKIGATFIQSLGNGDIALAIAAAAREETRWPQSVRDKVVEECLFQDDDDDEPNVESETFSTLAEAHDEEDKDELKCDSDSNPPDRSYHSSVDLFHGSGVDGVFFDYSRANAMNAPFFGTLGPRLLDAISERAKQRQPRVIAVGDVHGCIDELQDLLRQCDYCPGDLVILLGDLVCKGPDSLSVVQMAREIGAIGVRGNHDFEVIRWHQAIKSGADPPVVGSEHYHIASCLSKADMNWLYTLPWYISSKELGCLFVHAGFVSGIRLAKQNPRLMMNMRSILPDGTVTSKFFNNWPWARLWDGPQTVLFGHDADRGLQQYEHALGLDTGCVYGGRLTACILPEKRLVSVSARREYFKYRRKHYD